MATLYEKANEILTEKTQKIIPSNIKKDIEIFDVTGTLESGAKIYKNLKEMQSDITAKEGDYGIVYDKQINFWDGTSTDIVLFPKVVTMPEAVTSSHSFDFYGNSIYGSVYISNATTAYVQADDYEGSDSPYITYTSTDGITYISDKSEDYIWKPSKPISYSSTPDDYCKQFLMTKDINFEGFFEYKTTALPNSVSILLPGGNNNGILVEGADKKVDSSLSYAIMEVFTYDIDVLTGLIKPLTRKII